jgi:hypothetical protein
MATQLSLKARVPSASGCLDGFEQRCAHFLDFADPGAHFDGEVGPKGFQT